MAKQGTTPHQGWHAPCTKNSRNAQVFMSLTVSERIALESIASNEMRSLSATARMLFLEGLRTYQHREKGEA